MSTNGGQVNIKNTLIGVIVVSTLIPALFYLSFGEVGPVGFGLTKSFWLPRHCSYVWDNTPIGKAYAPSNAIIIRDDWLTKTFTGLVFFVLGPLIGLFVQVQRRCHPEASWRWQYGIRVFLAIVIPTGYSGLDTCLSRRTPDPDGLPARSAAGHRFAGVECGQAAHGFMRRTAKADDQTQLFLQSRQP
jgi:hypothetical protein